MAAAGYELDGIPPDGNALIEAMAAGPTNAAVAGREVRERLGLDEYLAFFAALPEAVRRAVGERWGGPERDPFFVEPARRSPSFEEPARPGPFFAGSAQRTPSFMDPAGAKHGEGRPAVSGSGPFSMESAGGGAFAVPALRFGNVVVGLQPARGYHIDPAATYHDPALVPRTATSRSTPGCGRGCTPWCTWASTGTWNGCRARRWRCPRSASRRPRSAPCPTSIRSSSTTRGRGRRPSAARRR